MDRYVVTGFDDNYWPSWGSSWILSLKEFAKFNDNILVVDLGLSQSAKAKLSDFGAYVLPAKGKGRLGIFRTISDFAADYPGIFAVWDADVYFQKPIDEIFELARHKIAITENPGFYAVSGQSFPWLREMQDMLSFIFRNDIFFHESLKNHFLSCREIIDNTWNFIDVSRSLEDQKVIHPSGKIKSLLPGRDILFWERHKELFDAAFSTKHHMGRKLLKSVIAQQE